MSSAQSEKSSQDAPVELKENLSQSVLQGCNLSLVTPDDPIALNSQALSLSNECRRTKRRTPRPGCDCTQSNERSITQRARPAFYYHAKLALQELRAKLKLTFCPTWALARRMRSLTDVIHGFTEFVGDSCSLRGMQSITALVRYVATIGEGVVTIPCFSSVANYSLAIKNVIFFSACGNCTGFFASVI